VFREPVINPGIVQGCVVETALRDCHSGVLIVRFSVCRIPAEIRKLFCQFTPPSRVRGLARLVKATEPRIPLWRSTRLASPALRILYQSGGFCVSFCAIGTHALPHQTEPRPAAPCRALPGPAKPDRAVPRRTVIPVKLDWTSAAPSLGSRVKDRSAA
jgi:hypothetical protein